LVFGRSSDGLLLDGLELLEPLELLEAGLLSLFDDEAGAELLPAGFDLFDDELSATGSDEWRQ
jgi:hypothetical protein